MNDQDLVNAGTEHPSGASSESPRPALEQFPEAAPERLWITSPVQFNSLISKAGPAFDSDVEYVLARWLDDALVRAAEDQDEHSEQRAKLVKENESLHARAKP